MRLQRGEAWIGAREASACGGLGVSEAGVKRWASGTMRCVLCTQGIGALRAATGAGAGHCVGQQAGSRAMEWQQGALLPQSLGVRTGSHVTLGMPSASRISRCASRIIIRMTHIVPRLNAQAASIRCERVRGAWKRVRGCQLCTLAQGCVSGWQWPGAAAAEE